MDVGWWALVLSVLSFGISALTFWTNRVPKPRWVIEWDFGENPDDDLITDSIRCVARNRGRGIAHDIALIAVSVDGGDGWASQRVDERRFGESLELWFSFEDGRDSASGGFHAGEIMLHNAEHGTARFSGRQAKRTISVELEWSEEPSLHRRRRKTGTYTHP